MLLELILGVGGLNVFAAVLVLARAPLFGARVYRPMLLNIALSLAPLAVLGLALVVTLIGLVLSVPWLGYLAGAVLVGVWVLLLPNAGYLITELNLSHRRAGESVPMWYDVILVISLAMSGVLNTVLNVFVAQFAYAVTVYGDHAWAMRTADTTALVVVIVVLVAFGIYLGRHLRLNSWDMRRPWRLLAKVGAHLRQHRQWRTAVGFTVLYAVFLGLMYLALAGPVIHGLIVLEQIRGG